MGKDLRAGDRVISTCDIGSRLWKFVPRGSQGVVIEGGREPLIQFEVAEDMIGRLFPSSVEIRVRLSQVAPLER